MITEKPIENPSVEKRRGQNFLRYHLFPITLYLLGALIFSWPLLPNLANQVVLTGGGDAWAHLWNSWWVRYSLLNLHTTPFFTDMLYWPQGASLYFHALDPFTGYLSIPFQLLFGLVPAFNLMVLFEITLAGYSSMRLARYLTNNFPAALVAGVIYAFSPLESLYLNLGQLELMSIGWLPLFILFFIKTLRREPRLRLNFALSMIFLLIISLVTWYYALYALLFAGLFTLYTFFIERKEWRIRWLKTAGLAVGILAVYGVLISPVLLPTLKEAGGGTTEASQSIFNLVYNSADLQGFIAPGPSAIWSLFGATTSNEYRGVFLGFFALLLGIVGLIAQPKKGWFWAALAVIFLILALGPMFLPTFCYDLRVSHNTSGSEVFTCHDQATPQVENGVSLPDKILYLLPFGSIARVPLRFVLLVMLSLAILSAFALTSIQQWLGKIWQNRKVARKYSSSLVPAIAGLLIFLEFLPLPRTLHNTSYSPFYTNIKNEGNWNDFALLEMPDNVTAISEYYQTVDEHPMLSGYLSRKEIYPYDDTPGWYELRNLSFRTEDLDIVSRSSLANSAAVLAYYKVRYVVIHRDALSKDQAAALPAVIAATLGNVKPYYQDDKVTVYRVTEDEPDKIAPNQVVLDLADNGWGKLVGDGGNNVHRTIKNTAELEAFNPSKTAVTVTLSVQASGNAASLELQQITSSKVELGQETVTAQPKTLNFKVTLQPGLNRIEFQPSGPITISSISVS